MILNKSTVNRITILIIFLVLFFPPINEKRYTPMLFLFYLPLFFGNTNRYLPIFKLLMTFTISILAFLGLSKAFFFNSYLRDALIFYIYVPSVIFGSFIAGKEFAENASIRLKNILLALLVIELLICLLQYINPSIGILFTRIYSTEKYLDQFYLTSYSTVGTLGNYNYLGFLLFLGLVFSRNYLKKRNKLILSFFFLLGIISTRSRSALVFLLLYSFVYILIAFFSKKGGRKKLLIYPLLIIFLFIVILLLYYYGPVFFSYITRLTGRNQNALFLNWRGIFSTRILTWKNIETVNFNNFSILFGTNNYSRITVDNLYISLFLRYGIIGTIIIMLFLLGFHIKKSDGFSKAINISFLSVLLISGMIADYWINQFFGPIYIFLISTIIHKRN